MYLPGFPFFLLFYVLQALLLPHFLSAPDPGISGILPSGVLTEKSRIPPVGTGDIHFQKT